MRPFDFIDLGDRVVVQLRGRRHRAARREAASSRGCSRSSCCATGKVVSIQDYSTRGAALAAAGVKR